MRPQLIRIGVGIAFAAISFGGCETQPEEREAPADVKRTQAPGGAPNVLFVVVDTMRADRVGAYGNQPSPTAGLDQLADEGVLFELAFSSAPRTWQSFTSMLTGLQPPRHGVRHLFDEPLAANIDHLGEVLGRNGYRTAAFDVVPFLRWMLDGRGFDTFVDNISVESERQLGDAEILGKLLDWIGAAPAERPFFAFVRLHGPHWPYQPPQELHDRAVAAAAVDHDEIDHSFNVGSYGTEVRWDGHEVVEIRVDDPDARRQRIFGPPLPAAEHAHMLLHYDQALASTVISVDVAIRELQRRGILNDTLVVVTADHGESFGDGSGYTAYRDHGPRVDDAVLRVPLILRFPESHPHGTPGQRLRQLVRLVDLAPTILATIGLEIPSGLDGTSLLPAIDAGVDLGLEAYGESGFELPEIDPLRFLPGVPGKHRTWRNARWRLVWIPNGGDGIELLFDMHRNGEAEDVGAAHPAVRRGLRAKLDAVIAADPEAASLPQSPSFTDAQKEQLRALGYR